jgi:hypothetical protein
VKLKTLILLLLLLLLVQKIICCEEEEFPFQNFLKKPISLAYYTFFHMNPEQDLPTPPPTHKWWFWSFLALMKIYAHSWIWSSGVPCLRKNIYILINFFQIFFWMDAFEIRNLSSRKKKIYELHLSFFLLS